MLGGRETSAIHKNDFSYLVIRDNKFLFFKKSLLIKLLTVTKLHIVIRSIWLCDQLQQLNGINTPVVEGEKKEKKNQLIQ